MPTDIPPEFQSFVSSLIARRRYLSESEVLSEGLRLSQARETLSEEVRKGFEQIKNGQCVNGPEAMAKLRTDLQSRK